jgi:DNA-binding beta-propeller fold protein YncE
MRQYVLMLVALLSAIDPAATAMAAKLKHQGSVYADSAGLSLRHPEGVACGENTFVVADTGNSRLVRYAISAQGMTPEAVYPLPGTSPIVVQVNSKGAIYLLDGKSRTLVKLDKNGQVIGKLQPKGLPDAQTTIPRSFKLGRDDNLYLLDIFSERVLVLNADETYIRQLAFPADYRFFSDLAVGADGSVYLLDSVAGAIYLASPGAESFALLSHGLKEHMNFPVSLAIASKGVLYLSDQYGSGMVQIGRDGSFQGRKFGMGWEDGQLYYPAQLCINNRDMLMVADRNNSRVQVFSILDE